MGALKSGMNGGGAARGDHRDGASPNCNRRGSNFATGNNNNLGLAADVLEENGSEQAVKGESSSHAYELYRTGQTVTQMQSLVEGDAEIRQLLLYLRRQVARAETRSAAYQLDDEGGQLQRSQRGFFMWPCCCCPEPDTPSGDRLRRTLRLLGPVLHPDARFRSIWNVSLAVLIVYCGVAIPFEIAFEDDMLYEMCKVPPPTPITPTMRNECPSWQVWVWFNFVVDLWFICDVFLNLRTGCVLSLIVPSLSKLQIPLSDRCCVCVLQVRRRGPLRRRRRDGDAQLLTRLLPLRCDRIVPAQFHPFRHDRSAAGGGRRPLEQANPLPSPGEAD